MSLTIFDNYPEYKNLVSDHVKKDVDEIIYAQRGRSTRRDFSGRVRRPSKLFFVGEPGTGKTLTAGIMIKELKKKAAFRIHRTKRKHISRYRPQYTNFSMGTRGEPAGRTDQL